MRTLLSAVLLWSLSAPAFAMGPTEAEQRRACTGDVFRFCARTIGDRSQVTACMVANHDRLSPQCRTVYDATLAVAGRS